MSQERFAKLAAYIQHNLSKDPRRVLEPDTPLISSGLVDSLSLISVLAFIEDEFAVVIPDEAATAEAMNTIRQIGALIDTYDSGGQG
jgi:acyl carrier protein